MSIDQKPGNSFYHPSKEVKKKARIKDYDKLYQESIKDREGFWSRETEELSWYKPWETVLDDSGSPFYKWFTGGKTNVVANVLKAIADKAMRRSPTIDVCITVKRTNEECYMDR